MYRDFCFPVKEYRVIDGDNVEVVFDRGFNDTKKGSCRILGIDCPEMYGIGGEVGRLVASVVRQWLYEVGREDLRVWSASLPDKYAGRFLGDLFSREDPGTTLGCYLVANKLAKIYDHGSRKWYADEIEDLEQRALEILGA